MSHKTLGVLVHGAGWVSTQHLTAWQRNPRADVLAMSSRSADSARQRVAECGLNGIAIYDDFAQALQHPGIDVVSICTPQHIHCPNVIEAARMGKHLVIEKPIGNSMAELAAMRDAVQSSGIKTVVSFVLRWNPLFQTLKALIARDAIGKPFYVEADYLSHNGSWWSGWNDARTAEQGVSAMLVGGCHAVDALRWFAASGQYEAARPVEVYGVSGGYRKGMTREYNPITNRWTENAPPMQYDGLEVLLVRFDNGAVGKVSVNADCIMPYRFPLRVFGDRGSIFDNEVWSHLFPGQNDWVRVPAIAPDSSDVSHHPFQAEIDHFVDCIERDVESHCNLEDAIVTHQVVFAAQQCYDSGQPVQLPLV